MENQRNEFEVVEDFGDFLFNIYTREDNFISIVKNNWDVFAITLAKTYVDCLSYSLKLIELEKAKKMDSYFTHGHMKSYFRLRYLFCKWLVNNESR
jgi:hypothetical protein